MASSRDYGWAPRRPERESREPWRRFEVDDESGARPLPRESFDEQVFDDEIELPLERPRLGGPAILAGLGLALFALLLGLYLGGWVGRPKLNPPEPPAPLVPNSVRFDEWVGSQALERARVAGFERAAPAVAPPAVESSDIRVIDDAPTPSAAPPSTPRAEPETRAVPPSAEPLDALPDVAPPVLREPEMPALEHEISPETEPLPAPASPTAPAETIPPEGSNGE